MELSELQNLWLENNRKLEQTLHINRVILDQLIRTKSGKRLTLIKTEAFITLLMPFVLLLLIAFGVWNPGLKIHVSFQFYFGIFLFGIVFLTNYVLSAYYYWLLMKVDFTGKMVEIKTRIVKAEAYKLKLTRLSYLMMPFGIAGVFMILGVPIFSPGSELPLQAYLPLFLIVVVFIGSVFVSFKYTLVQRFKKLKAEIVELEKLAKEE